MVVKQPMGRLNLVKEVLRKMVQMLMVKEIQKLQLMEMVQMVKTREIEMEQM